jgi:hypothetical protein
MQLATVEGGAKEAARLNPRQLQAVKVLRKGVEEVTQDVTEYIETLSPRQE